MGFVLRIAFSTVFLSLLRNRYMNRVSPMLSLVYPSHCYEREQVLMQRAVHADQWLT